MTKKNVHKENLSIIQEFVDIVNKDNLLELEYEANNFKVKVVKNMKTPISMPQETNVPHGYRHSKCSLSQFGGYRAVDHSHD